MNLSICFFDWLQAWWTTVRNHWTLGFSQHFQTKLPVCCRLGPLKKAERTLTKVELRPKGRPKSWVGRWFPFFEWIFGDFEVDYHQEFRKSMFFHVFFLFLFQHLFLFSGFSEIALSSFCWGVSLFVKKKKELFLPREEDLFQLVLL